VGNSFSDSKQKKHCDIWFLKKLGAIFLDHMHKFETLKLHVHEIHAKLCLNLISIEFVEFVKFCHKRPWHLNYHNKHLLTSRKLIHELPLFCSTNKTNYHVCLLWKASMWEGHEKNASQTLKPLWLVYNDYTWDHLEALSFSRTWYFITFTNNYNKKIFCVFFQRKKKKC
jgi:hypothetical protein